MKEKNRKKKLSKLFDKLATLLSDSVYEELADGSTDKLFNKIEKLEKGNIFLDKNKRWQFNHALIVNCIDNEITQGNITPTAVDIAKKTGLSRTTVHKHLKEIGDRNGQFDNMMNTHYMLIEHSLSKMYREAETVKDSQSYISTVLKVKKSFQPPPPKNQTNNIQVNNYLVQILQKLPPEKQEEITTIILEKLDLK